MEFKTVCNILFRAQFQKACVTVTIIKFKHKKNVQNFLLLILWPILILKSNFLIKTALNVSFSKLLQFVLKGGERNIVSCT